MHSTPSLRDLADRLRSRLGGSWRVQALGASSFCETWRADSSSGALFVKRLPAARADVLEAEADGLAALAAAGCVRVPGVAACWVDGGEALLALEWLDFAPREAERCGARLGRSLAALHQLQPPGDGRFGWHRDNFLGATPQPNRWSRCSGLAGWIEFVTERRLLPFAAGLPMPLPDTVRRVADRLPDLFDDGHVPRPSLIHGDLWSGNRACLADGAQVIFDPAVSVSDAEAELAMMELFGSPPAGFWSAYREAAAPSAGYERRRPMYQLVHLLNHARLFGAGYARQALGVAEALLR